MFTICVFLKCFLRYLLPDPDLSLARSFSLRNGIGCIPRPTFNDRDYELYTLLTSLTMAEEGAIRTITPLISITRLLHGNIGTKGNTSCVWQSNTRLIQLLPNLPSEVGVIFLSFCRRGGNPELTSHGFKRCNIACALYLLQRTGLDPWTSTQVSPQCLQEWPEEGNLVRVGSVTRVEERESETQSTSSSPCHSRGGTRVRNTINLFLSPHSFV
jgi:hypothetical protein